MTPPRLTTHHLRGAAASTLISTVFALAWGLNGSAALPDGWRTATTVVVVLVTLALVAVAAVFHRSAKRFPSDEAAPARNPFRTTAYRVAVTAMLVAIPVAGRVLTLTGQGDAIMPVVAIIVGLHFLGLVAAFRSRMFAWVAGAFCVLGAGALFLPVQVGEALKLRYAVVGLGCALVLWFGVVPLTVANFRQLFKSSG
ncbi:hypothetical protein BH24DEI2_BH24DEI2_09070 [soil metagenome]